MTKTITPAESDNNTGTPTGAELIGDHCFACKSTEAWHPCITEDDSTKYACDECAVSITIKPAPKPKPPRRRRFEFTAAFQNGHLFIELNDHALLTWKPSKFLELGRFAITTTHAIADSEDAEFYRGLDTGRELAEREREEAAARPRDNHALGR
ncbi:hypothetical protein WBG06_16240 [Nocardioides sp. CCNWLW239]|uniref:hypothetical protein n=1 Tax=Nocardioides sp. CCNWLW239 TaxID=3128902 RepID=UPI003016A9D7